MSHYAVMVVGENIDKQLEKFDENLEMKRYVEFTKQQLIDNGRKNLENYKNRTYAEFLKDPEKYESECHKPEHINYLKFEFPKKLEWSDEEVYQEEVKWYEPEDIGKDGEVYSTRNPNSKWDWYEIGGRYAGRLLLKDGVEKTSDPNFSWGWDENSIQSVLSEKRVDVAKKGDVDWNKIHKVKDKYDEAIRFWELKVEGAKPKNTKEEETLRFDLYKPEYYSDKYKDKETYATAMSNFTMWAIVIDGKWYEKSEMGWWGMSNGTNEDEVKWELGFYEKFIKDLPDDTILTVVDCHI